MKIPEPKRLKSGNWFIQLRLDGQSIPITAASKTECKQIAALTKAEYSAGSRSIKKPPKSITLSQATKMYIERYRQTLSPSTVRSYLIYHKTRFASYQDKQLSQINWQKMINEELLVVSEKTVKNAWGLVSPSLKLVGYPVPDIKLAAVPVSDRISFLQPDQIVPFVNAVHGRSYEIPALLELHGLRLSEVRGLTWNHIDLTNETITIRGAKVRGVDGDTYKDTNKNETSSRVVPIMIPQLLSALKAVPEKTGFVVEIGANTLLDDVKRSCRRAGIPEITNHDLRRSFASLCFYLEIPLKQIQEWGGWKDQYVLNKIYIHLSAVIKTESQKKVSSFFEEPKKQESTVP